MPADKLYDRQPFLDNLRSLLVLMVVVYHSARSYSNFGPSWCVRDMDAAAIIFDAALRILDVFLMPTLFFIAGYFALPSYSRWGARSFITKKLMRLGLPLLVVLPLISPTFAYIVHTRRNWLGQEVNFTENWLNYLSGVVDFQFGLIRSIDQFFQFHLWFLSLLLLFFMGFTGFVAANQQLLASTPSKPSHKAGKGSILAILGGVGLLATISSVMVSLHIPHPERWITIGNLIQFQPVKVVSYLLYFALGVWAYRRNWFVYPRMPGHYLLWCGLCLILSVCLLIVKTRMAADPSFWDFWIYFLVRSFLGISILCALTVWAAHRWNTTSPVSTLLATNSYYIYIVHLFAVIALQLILANWSNGSSILKFAVVSSGSIVICIGLSQYVLRPFMRRSIVGVYILLAAILIVNAPQ